MDTLKKPSLFWDTETPDPKKHKQFIMERILNFGDKKDYFWAFDFYGKEEIKKALVKSKTLSDKSLNFWCEFFNIERKKCLINQSAKTHGAFWKK